MRLYLALLPFDADHGEWGFSHTILSLERRSELFDAILKLEEERGQPVPEEFGTYLCRDDEYEEAHYGNTQGTPYGEQLMWVSAGGLMGFGWHESISETPKNDAAWAYLRALPPQTKVALYWY